MYFITKLANSLFILFLNHFSDIIRNWVKSDKALNKNNLIDYQENHFTRADYLPFKLLGNCLGGQENPLPPKQNVNKFLRTYL
ncbi:MAG: hypothetical protein DRQ49_03395 [Gammaproteobacteria bacterium]|nr:MAG: hypothetical protein DRQ49_03395 [Gammaproteobacteria bacterium]RKZ42247.1 MAG: hypothetical protein DRQ41_07210 [Gammaproteobacteria bacterium]RKZ76739.1 MAG: hypothetical protein DRQ57_02755 [Gammaproteobacteria bacterium]